jgi:tripartite ATP-independent transporter DctM subunit
MSLTVLFILFVAMLILGMPIAIAMLASSLLYALFNGMELGFLAIQMYSSLNNFVILAIPFFLLASEVMDRTSVATRMFGFANSIFGVIPGGLGHVNVVTNMIFAGMSGSAVADAGGIGRLNYRAMVENGYPRAFSMSLTAATAVIGPIIPPSIPMVVYAMVANESVAKLFFGGVIPGILLGISLMIYVYWTSLRRGYRSSATFSVAGVLKSSKEAFLPLMTPLMLLGGIYFGVVTVTEASVLAVTYACALGVFAYRLLTLRHFIDSLRSVFRICGPIFIMFPAAKVFGLILITEDVPAQLLEFVGGFAHDPLMIVIFVNAVFFILGCFSDPLVNIMLFMPLFMPLIKASGLSAVHFGVMVVLNCMIGLITPPVGALLFITSSFDEVRFSDLIKEVWPFVVIEAIVLLIIILVPATVTFIPDLLFKAAR